MATIRDQSALFPFAGPMLTVDGHVVAVVPRDEGYDVLVYRRVGLTTRRGRWAWYAGEPRVRPPANDHDTALLIEARANLSVMHAHGFEHNFGPDLDCGTLVVRVEHDAVGPVPDGGVADAIVLAMCRDLVQVGWLR